MQGSISRHKTAISRAELSRPIKVALSDGILSPDLSIFDYGCGHGDDLRLLAKRGIKGHGWDPVHRPQQSRQRAPVVNLGYVVNVIESPTDRRDALRSAWDLTENVLIVSGRLSMEARGLGEAEDYADGVLTSRGTFQKFFDQQELRNWIDQTLEAQSVPAAPGVFYVFRDEGDRTQFIASRFRRRLTAPRLNRSTELFNEHKELLQPLIEFFRQRGRLPVGEELSNSSALIGAFGSIRRAFRVVLTVTSSAGWEPITRERRADLLVYLALAQFDGRPAFGRLPAALQRDVKAFFSNHKNACARADDILFSLGQPDVVASACREAHIGKLTPTALYVHESALNSLSQILRLYEGCARGYLGRVDGANIIKLYRNEAKISYLIYPDFERDPHPALASSITVHLQTFQVRNRDYSGARNRPILHRKELFVAPDHPQYRKWERLTRIEDRKGLLDDISRIGFQGGWEQELTKRGLYLSGHRLLSRGEPENQIVRIESPDPSQYAEDFQD